MMDSSKDRVSYTLQTDDYIDYIIVVALVIVAVGGFLMWRKLQEQKQKILLWLIKEIKNLKSLLLIVLLILINFYLFTGVLIL